MKTKNRERIMYQGISHEVVRRFVFKEEKKIELRNPSNNNQFVIAESALNQ